MTTSGTSSFNETRDQIIRAALRKIGAISAGEIPGAQLVKDTSDQLNSMVKSWEGQGIHIWTETEAILYTSINQISYVLGTNSPDHTNSINSTTTLSANVNQGSTTIQVASTASVAIGNAVGVILNDGLTFWSTVVSFTSSSITIALATTDSATAGGFVYLGTSNIVRPLRIVSARRYDQIAQLATPMMWLSRIDYFNLPNKNTSGTITSYYYDPRGGATNTGILYLWPAPVNSVNNNLEFTYYRPIQDFNVSGDTPDLPQEWLNTLVWNLAMEMAPEFGVPADVYSIVEKRALMSLEEIKGWDKEPEPSYFGVDFSQMGA